MYDTEFTTIIDKPYIEIPEYEKFKNHKVKIMLIDLKQQSTSKNQKQQIKNILENTQEQLFSSINNPLDWQKNIREEWE